MDENTSNSSAPQSETRKLLKSVEALIGQIKTADLSLASLKENIAKIDKEAAKQRAKQELSKLRGQGMAEAEKIKARVQKEFDQLNGQLKEATEQLKAETKKARSKAESLIGSLKTQIKTVADNERAKRSGKSPDKSE